MVDRLVDDDLLDQFCLEEKVDLQDESDSTVKLKQLEIQKEIELAKFQMQEEERKEKLQLEHSRAAMHIHCAQNVKTVRLCTEFNKRISNIFLICHTLWHFQDGRL